MCLTIKESGFEMIAEEDMTVYKVIRTDNTSQMQRFPYDPGAQYTLPPADSAKFNLAGLKPRKDDGWRRVYSGFHAYITKEEAEDRVAQAYAPAVLKVVAFTVPKGAHYYLGFYEEIVSDQIIAGDLKAL